MDFFFDPKNHMVSLCVAGVYFGGMGFIIDTYRYTDTLIGSSLTRGYGGYIHDWMGFSLAKLEPAETLPGHGKPI